jgi:hypothetical protein
MTWGEEEETCWSLRIYATRRPFGWVGGDHVMATDVLEIGWMEVISGGVGSPLGSVRIGLLSRE